MYTVASPDSDPRHRGKGVNYLTLTSAIMSGSSGGVELVGRSPHLLPLPILYIITVANLDPDPNHGSEVSLLRAKNHSNVYFCHKSIRNCYTSRVDHYLKNNFSSFASSKEKINQTEQKLSTLCKRFRFLSNKME